jgi:hypothetical protein
VSSLESSIQQIAKETIENETQTIETDAEKEIEESFNCKTCEFPLFYFFLVSFEHWQH